MNERIISKRHFGTDKVIQCNFRFICSKSYLDLSYIRTIFRDVTRVSYAHADILNLVFYYFGAKLSDPPSVDQSRIFFFNLRLVCMCI